MLFLLQKHSKETLDEGRDFSRLKIVYYTPTKIKEKRNHKILHRKADKLQKIQLCGDLMYNTETSTVN